jgi:hypothetical protein
MRLNFNDHQAALEKAPKNTILFVRAGSKAYGTSIASSDDDYRGVYVPHLSDLFSFRKTLKQFDCQDPDIVVHDIQKLFKLAAQANPNILEILFSDERDILFATDEAETILQNRDAFLSKRCKTSFLGYASSEFSKVQKSQKLDFKNMMHVVRLVRMCKEIFLEGRPHIRRQDADELLEIRNGNWSIGRLTDWFERERKEIDSLCDSSSLRSHPDEEFLDDLLFKILNSCLLGQKFKDGF